MTAAASHVAGAMALAAVRLGVGGEARAMLGLRGDEPPGSPEELAAPRPAGWRLIHPSWLDGADAAADDVYQARIAYGALVPMGGNVLVALEPAVLIRTLSSLGRRQLAYALVGSAPRSIADMAARLPWGKELVADVAAVHALGPGAEARLGTAAAARGRTAGLVWTDPLALPRAGARAIAHTVAGIPDLALQLAQRLARPVGTVLLTDLHSFASAPGASATEIRSRLP